MSGSESTSNGNVSTGVPTAAAVNAHHAARRHFLGIPAPLG